MSNKPTKAESADGATVEDAVHPPATAPIMSKNQQKKMAKLQRKQEMHRQRKEKKKEEKAVKREERKAHKVLRESSLTEEERAAKTAMREKRSRERIEHHAAVAKRLKEAEATAPKLVIDLSFWDKMTDGYQRSLVSQLAFSAGCNKKADKPCGMHFTSFHGGVQQATARQFPGHPNWAVTFHTAHWSSALSEHKASLIYLTADSEEEIHALDTNCYYLIGGLVDRNQHKNICLHLAQQHGIRTARLPLQDYLPLTGSKVLTVNQVVSILVNYWGTQNWKKACEIAVPGRKRDPCNQEDSAGITLS